MDLGLGTFFCFDVFLFNVVCDFQKLDCCVGEACFGMMKPLNTGCEMNFTLPSFSGMTGGLQGFEAPMTRAEAGAMFLVMDSPAKIGVSRPRRFSTLAQSLPAKTPCAKRIGGGWWNVCRRQKM